MKDSKYVKIVSVSPLYLMFNKMNGYMFNKMNGYFEEINRNKCYLTPVLTNESKEKIKKYEELWIKIRDIIKSVTKKSDDFDEKYIKVKFDLDDNVPLNKTREISVMIILVRAIFYGNNKYYTQVFLDECLYEL